MYSILYIIKLPPPVNGATTMNKYVSESEVLTNNFNNYYINYGLTESNNEFGTIKLYKLPKYFIALFKTLYLLLSEKINLVYITIAPKGLPFIKDSVFIWISKLLCKNVVIHLHGGGIRSLIGNPIYKIYYKFLFKDCHLICLAKRLICDIEDVYDSMPFVIPNGIIPNENNYSNKLQGKFKILFLSNLYYSKGIIEFLDVVEKLIRDNKIEFEALIVGNATTDISVEELIAEIKIRKLNDHVCVLGPKYGSEKIEILNSSNILLFLSKIDTFGLVTIEAFEAGIPVIANNVGGIPDIIQNGKNGYIVENNNIDEICRYIYVLHDNKELLSEISKYNVITFNEKYQIKHFEKNILKTFKDILGL